MSPYSVDGYSENGILAITLRAESANIDNTPSSSYEFCAKTTPLIVLVVLSSQPKAKP